VYWLLSPSVRIKWQEAGSSPASLVADPSGWITIDDGKQSGVCCVRWLACGQDRRFRLLCHQFFPSCLPLLATWYICSNIGLFCRNEQHEHHAVSFPVRRQSHLPLCAEILSSQAHVATPSILKLVHPMPGSLALDAVCHPSQEG
jgi:hypothetical protein